MSRLAQSTDTLPFQPNQVAYSLLLPFLCSNERSITATKQSSSSTVFASHLLSLSQGLSSAEELILLYWGVEQLLYP